MRILLFCEVAYSFAILKPLQDAALRRNWNVDWYLPPNLDQKFAPQIIERIFNEIGPLINEKYDAIFVPGNEVPYYLHGVKIQIFHGFAGEKSGHFRIRHYFDLYLTQGPYFTQHFRALQSKYHDFEVVETGWSKLDPYFDNSVDVKSVNEKYRYPGLPLLLYAPTFSKTLTSARVVLPELQRLASTKKYQIIVKFHPLMDMNVVSMYKSTFRDDPHITIADHDDLIPLILAADLMISDTSSAIYENIIVGKPAITIRTKTSSPLWRNIDSPNLLEDAIKLELCTITDNNFSLRTTYHPYRDGRSAERMLDATDSYIHDHGVPTQRSLGFWRRLKIHRKYGAPK